jgi:PAS domain S-box-containing protein
MPSVSKPVRVLLVEDDEGTAIVESIQLEKKGYEVCHAISGEESIEIVKNRTNKFDIILMDIDLGSGLDGTEAAREILRKTNIPILFLSSHTDIETIEKTEKITSYGYVVKNTGIIILDASIKMALRLFNANNRVKESEESIRHVFDYTALGVCLINLDGKYIKVNKVFCDKLNYQEEELLGLNFNDITYCEDCKKGYEYYERMLKNEIENAIFEKRYVSKLGKIIWCLVSVSLVRDYNNQPKLFLTQISDINYIKESETIIRNQEEEIKLALEIARIGYWKLYCKSKKVEWYHNHEKLFGIKYEDFGGTFLDVQNLVHPEDRKMREEILEKTFREKSIYENKYRVIHPDGRIKKLHSYGYLHLDVNNEPDYIFGITQDVSGICEM